jgi:excisionase family DNA binding protein
MATAAEPDAVLADPNGGWVDLVGRIKSGEPGSTEELYRLFSKGIRFYLCRQLGPQELDDKVHDTFVVVVQAIRRGELREPERLMGFVRTIVRRQVAAHIDKVVHSRREQVELDSTVRVADPRKSPEETDDEQSSQVSWEWAPYARYEAIRRGGTKLAGPDGESSLLPDSLDAFLLELSKTLNNGSSVSIFRDQVSLTTAESAGILGMSRQFLVNLLTSGEIPHHMVGTHRRIYVQDLMKYKAERDGHRKKALRDLVQAEVREGLYDKVPPA